MSEPYDDGTMWSKLHMLAEVACMFVDEEKRAKKGKSKIFYEEDDDDDQVERLERLFESVPRKARSRINYETLSLSGPSTSSPLLLDLNTIPPQSPNPTEPSSSRVFESKEMEMKNPRRSKPSSSRFFDKEPKYPPNPSSKSKKRKHTGQVPGQSKKAKVVHLSWKGRGMPEALLQVMRVLNVEDQDPKLIFERGLFKTDVDRGQGRLSMPISQIFRNDFLTPEEVEILQQDINHGTKYGIGAFLVNEKSQMWHANLKRWESSTSWNYSVIGGWNDYVAANGLGVNSGISVWVFRWRGTLCFAIIDPPKE